MGTALNTIPSEWTSKNCDVTSEDVVVHEVTPPLDPVSSTPYVLPEDIGSMLAAASNDSEKVSPSVMIPAQGKSITFGEYSLSIDEVYRDIKRLTLSKNPLDLIFKANEIREKFAFFINSLAGFISRSFSLEDETFSYELYHDAEYHRVWMELITPFIRDRQYITDRLDSVTYFVKKEDGLSQELPIDINLLIEHAKNNALTEDDFSMVQKVVKIIIEYYRGDETISKRIALQDIANKSDFETTNLHELSKKTFQKSIQEIHAAIEQFPYEKA